MSSASLETGSQQGAGLSEDDVFEVLSNPRRRYAVHVLKDEDEPTEIGPLAEQVAAWENEIEVPDVSHAQRKRVYTALQQSHLPKMEEAGVVEFDKDRGVIEPTPTLEDVEIYMDVVRGNDLAWSEYYLGLSAIGGLLLAVNVLGVWPIGPLPDLSVSVFLLVVFLVSALVHRYHTSVMVIGSGNDPPELE